ncbi:SLAP domain-containing protein [Oceanobacillus damuensis]|uniref:SLAP domain-containing protein n=1 Tax=Oceanobacillus damuensis TaxID=937928 RepID=UPI00082B86BE|nr:SLAP domain-containing protein [Oceanobacillus damuensis]
MQKLRFEASWDKALPDRDRKAIENAFSQYMAAASPSEPSGKYPHYSEAERRSPKNQQASKTAVDFVPLWQTKNYRGELLITVLVHNFSDEVFNFNQTKLRYMENEEIIAEHPFTIPQLTLAPETSMPWAFIFPAESIKARYDLENGKLEIVN